MRDLCFSLGRLDPLCLFRVGLYMSAMAAAEFGSRWPADAERKGRCNWTLRADAPLLPPFFTPFKSGLNKGPMLAYIDQFAGPNAWDSFASGADRLVLDQHP